VIPLIIAKKRDGEVLTRAELEQLVMGYVRGDVPDYQVAAWLMASYLNGLTDAETLALTEIMAASGEHCLCPSKIKTSPSMSKAQGLLAIGCGNRTHTGQVP
jgi:thymidine phosphorylase